MSITIEVYRNAGARPGDEIREPLLGDSLPAALARGRAELDDQAHAWERAELELDLRQDLAIGALVRVDDPVQGATWTGRIIGIRHADDGATLTTRIDVRRPL